MAGTPYRWLDVERLARRLCNEQNPNSELVSAKYFTAIIKAKLSRRGTASCEAQQTYLRGIKAYSRNLEIVLGKYLVEEASYHAFQTPVDFDKKYTVWRAEEKQTDVSIAVQMMNDVFDDRCDQIVVFSNDSDLAPALASIKERYPQITIGVVAPIRMGNRYVSSDLKQYSDWTRGGIREEELRDSQLPEMIPTKKSPIRKPQHW